MRKAFPGRDIIMDKPITVTNTREFNKSFHSEPLSYVMCHKPLLRLMSHLSNYMPFSLFSILKIIISYCLTDTFAH